MGTLALVQPVLAPYLFMAMKFFPGSLYDEGLNYSHPLTTTNEKWGTFACAVFIFRGLSSIDVAFSRKLMEAFFDLTKLSSLEENVFFSGHQLYSLIKFMKIPINSFSILTNELLIKVLMKFYKKN